jgi:hypothetical protein
MDLLSTDAAAQLTSTFTSSGSRPSPAKAGCPAAGSGGAGCSTGGTSIACSGRTVPTPARRSTSVPQPASRHYPVGAARRGDGRGGPRHRSQELIAIITRGSAAAAASRGRDEVVAVIKSTEGDDREERCRNEASLLSLLASAVAGAPATAQEPGTLTIYAAASLSSAFEGWAPRSGDRIRMSAALRLRRLPASSRSS